MMRVGAADTMWIRQLNVLSKGESSSVAMGRSHLLSVYAAFSKSLGAVYSTPYAMFEAPLRSKSMHVHACEEQ